MSDDEQIQRSRIARRVRELWGNERTVADAGVIASASQALARIGALQVEATIKLDRVEESERE